MSEEMKEPMQTDNDCKTEEAAASTTETMADYEDHFDDANPWNLVTKYMEEKTVLPVKVEAVLYCAMIGQSHILEGKRDGLQSISAGMQAGARKFAWTKRHRDAWRKNAACGAKSLL